MDRRQFLKSLVGGGILVGAAVAVPAVAKAIFTHPYQKHIDALRMMDEAIVFGEGVPRWNNSLRQEENYNIRKNSNFSVQLHSKVDELINHLHNNWNPPEDTEENRKAIRELLCGGQYNGEVYKHEVRSIPPTVIDAVWPVLMMKALLRDYQLPINHRALTTFTEFHTRYGWLILEEPKKA